MFFAIPPILLGQCFLQSDFCRVLYFLCSVFLHTGSVFSGKSSKTDSDCPNCQPSDGLEIRGIVLRSCCSSWAASGHGKTAD
jgi:hypothetical protein